MTVPRALAERSSLCPGCGAAGATRTNSDRGLIYTCSACHATELDADGLHLREDDVRQRMRAIERDREARRRLAEQERPPVVLPEILILRDRLARTRQPVRMRIQGLQPCGANALFVGHAKAGKTTARDNLIESLVDGVPFLGRFAVTPVDGRVVVLDTEMAPRQLDDWLEQRGIRHDDRVVPISLKRRASTFNILDPRIRSQWVEKLRDLETAHLFVDSLRPILDGLGINENTEVGRFLAPFDELLDAAGIPESTVIHHMGHVGERPRGDSYLRAWPDVEWSLVRQSEDPAAPRYFRAFGRDVDQPEVLLTYHPASRRLTVAGGSRRDAVARGVLDDVLAALHADAAPLSVRGIQTALAESTDHPRAAVRKAIAEGVSAGEITTSRGPNGAILHAPACQRADSVPVACQHSLPGACQDSVCQCAASIRERHAGTHAGAGADPPGTLPDAIDSAATEGEI